MNVSARHLAFLLVVLLGQNLSLGAQEFRIETQVYSANNSEPISQNVTLFSGGLIYDFQLTNDAQPKTKEIAIYNSRDQSTELLDVDRKMRLTFQQVELIQMLEGLRQQTSQNESMSFLLDNNYKEEIDVSSGWVQLKNDYFEYRYQGSKPDNASIMPPYFEFIDNFTMLNVSDPSKLPPFARLRLNRAIKKYGLIPSKIEVTLKANGLFKEEVRLRSEHVLNGSLSDQDQARIKEAKTYWMSFEQVKLRKYRNLVARPRLALIPKAKNVSDEQDGKSGSKKASSQSADGESARSSEKD